MGALMAFHLVGVGSPGGENGDPVAFGHGSR